MAARYRSPGLASGGWASVTRRKRTTSTSSFGSKGRESHDSSRFYSGKIYQAPPANASDIFYQLLRRALEDGPIDTVENPVPDEVLDRIFCKDSRVMDELPDSSVHLMVTSPPYNVGKAYDDDLSLEEYRDLLRAVFMETYRVLVPGGRACVNVANVGRKPYLPYHLLVTQEMVSAGFVMRGEIIWHKGASSGASTAWGSWRSPSNPTLRDVHEYILVFSKGPLRRDARGRRATISSEEFLEYTKSVWSFPAESATRVGHPAPFPVELPYRLIQLYTYEGEVVLDPFAGSGTTCVAALQAGRHFVAYEIDPSYVDLARRRLVGNLFA